jgi:hypothetical protein
MNTLHFSRRALWRCVMAGATTLAFGAAVQAQGWPTKPVTIVVPFPAGGGTDAFARPLSAQLSKMLGKQFIIDNKGGAGGTVGAGLLMTLMAFSFQTSTMFVGSIADAVAGSKPAPMTRAAVKPPNLRRIEAGPDRDMNVPPCPLSPATSMGANPESRGTPCRCFHGPFRFNK